MTVVMITGTGTGVGKTVATAALACHARLHAMDVAVCKPVQTGTIDGDDDLATVGRLSGATELVGLARYPQPLAPVAAAAEAGMALPTRTELVDFVRATDRPDRLTLVEGPVDWWWNSAPTASRCETWPKTSPPRSWWSSALNWAR